MESLNTIHQLRSGNRLLMITKSNDSVDIRITKYNQRDSVDEIEEELNIPITMETYNRLVSEMAKSCQHM